MLRILTNTAALMKYLLAAAFVTILLSAPARAQLNKGLSPEKTPLDLKYEREEKEQKETEKAYNDQMKRLKAQNPSSSNSDPWKAVRPTGDSGSKR